MLPSFSNKSHRLVSLVQSNRLLLPVNTYSTYSNLRVPRNVEYIPGVQGYAPGFGPPPLKPKKNKKTTKAKTFAKKSAVDSANIEALVASAKVTFSKDKFLKEKIASKTSYSSSKIEIHSPKVSVAFIQQQINPLKVSYEKKMSLVRQRYRMEMQALEQKRQEDERVALETKKAEQDLEKEKQEKLAQELLDRRMQDQLSFDKVLEETESTETLPSTNPFTDPVRKAARLSAKKENFDNAVASKKYELKTALLKLYYKSSSYITPENIEDKLDDFLNKTSGNSINSEALDKTVFKLSTDPGFDTTERINEIKDILNDAIDGQPNVDSILNYKSNNTLVSGYISDLISNPPNPSKSTENQ